MSILVKDKHFYASLFKIALPVTLQSTLLIGINMADTIMVGSLGEFQLSATSLSNSFYHIFQILCFGIGYGAAVLTAQYWGANKIPELKRVITIMLRITMVFAALFTVVTILNPDSILNLYTPDQRIIEHGVKYLRLIAVTYIMHGLSQTLTITLRSVGIVRLPLLTTALSFVLNIFLNWIFIFGNLGAPRLEIAGAALASLIARSVEAVIIVFYFLRIDDRIKYKLRDFFEKCSDQIRGFIRYAVPVIISDVLLALGMNAVAIVMGHIGAAFVAAHAVVAVINQLSSVMTQGLSNASSIITGHTLGQKKINAAYDQGKTFLLIGAAVGAIAGIVVIVAGPPWVAAYKLEYATLQIADQLILASAAVLFFRTIGNIMTKGVLRGGGDTRFLMVADILFLWAASVPLGYLAAFVWKLSAFAIFMFLNIDQIIKALWCVHRFRTKKWIRTVAAESISS